MNNSVVDNLNIFKMAAALDKKNQQTIAYLSEKLNNIKNELDKIETANYQLRAENEFFKHKYISLTKSVTDLTKTNKNLKRKIRKIKYNVITELTSSEV
uniref:Uncharacterized protein n=1 Tax=Cryptophlebia leucotreta granulosis virus TaxID=35254 RepID=A0A2H4ZKH7_GVCL|nr:hypothetical protein [Cryptophlebia leucotreta granulovirus]